MALVWEVPQPRYVFDDEGTAIAYQSIGAGSPALLVVHGMGGTIEMLWDLPGFAGFFERLAERVQVVQVEKRGHGISGGPPDYPSLETRIGDVLRVMDELGINRAVLMGVSEGGVMCTLAAAAHPDRISGLVLCGAFARITANETYDWGVTDTEFLDGLRQSAPDWGTPEHGAPGRVSPRLADNAEWVRVFNRMLRIALAPDAVVPAWELVMQMDTRDVLGAIQCPTLVIHSVDDQVVPVGMGQYLAEHIPTAELLEVDSSDHLVWMGDPEWAGDAVAQLLGSLATRDVDQQQLARRRLATVLFTDIVDSTVTATRLGDTRWRALLDEHDRLTRRHVERHGGEWMKSTGDGVLAMFDGPGAAIGAATAIRDALLMIDLEIRAGVHTGEIELRGDDIGGVGVHIAARVDALANSGQVLATSTVRDLVAGSGIEFADAGTHNLKGIDRAWQLFEVTNGPTR